MKKIFKLFLSLVITLSLIAVAVVDKEQTETDAASLYTEIVDDSGNVVKYRNSSEAIMRLTEYNYPNQELRACWVSNFISSLPSYTDEASWKTNFNKVLDRMEEYGLNCIIFHVRTHNNALYNSKLNPIATWFKNVDFEEFDPLAWSIEETHRRGMEFHAWLNPYRVLDSYCAEDYPEGNPANDSSKLLTNGTGTILNPGIKSNRDFIVDTCMEVVEQYDVDAIHFDDYFYISGVETDKSADWKREQVNLFIEDLSNHLRTYNEENKKTVQLGISPSGIYRNGSYVSTPTYDANGNLTSPLYSNTSGFAHYDNYLYSDTLHWINEEWIDYIMPQTYWSLEHTAASFGALSRWWSWAVKNKDVNLYLGMGIYMPVDGGSSSTSSGGYWRKNTYEVRDQILNGSMYEEVGGFSYYSYNYLTNTNTYIKTGIDIVKNDYWAAKIPCDVKKYYADKYETVTPKNFFLNGNTLNFEITDDIRGHIVYKVSNQSKIDQTNLDQIYYYGKDSSIVLDNTTDYSYYIATVNLANEISEAVTATAANVDSAYVIEKINSIPSIVKVEQEENLNLILDAYNSLSDTEKAKVTNYQVLIDAINTVSKKKTGISELEDYVILSLYSTTNQEKLKTLLTNYKDQIDNLTDLLKIDDLVKEFKTEVDKIPTSNAELQTAMNEALTELESFYQSIDRTYYTEENLSFIDKIYNDSRTKIKNTTDIGTIKNIVNSAKTRINAIKSFKTDYENAIITIENTLNNHLAEQTTNKEWLNSYQLQLNSMIQELINEAKQVDKETLVTTINEYTTELVSKLDAKITAFETVHNAIVAAVNEVNTYEGQNALKEEYIAKLEKALTVDAVTSILTEFKTKYNENNKPSHEHKFVEGECVCGEKDPNYNPNVDPSDDKDCSLFGSLIFVNLISAISLLYLVIRKRY